MGLIRDYITPSGSYKQEEQKKSAQIDYFKVEIYICHN